MPGLGGAQAVGLGKKRVSVTSALASSGGTVGAVDGSYPLLYYAWMGFSCAA